ncbi:hypothetical protein [Kitasatospora sp. NPDC057223]|uniref:hypothetical protein n=1 Tax=Kitasatospora sp. NPDC057223 TaxID=3346055 RepID=UPI00363AD37A
MLTDSRPGHARVRGCGDLVTKDQFGGITKQAGQADAVPGTQARLLRRVSSDELGKHVVERLTIRSGWLIKPDPLVGHRPRVAPDEQFHQQKLMKLQICR